MERLKNKVAIVTGSADGIGFAISEAFANEGATVVMGDIDEKKCKQEAYRLSKEKKRVFPVYCDVGNTDSVNRMVKTCINNFGTIDVLVNNAATAISGKITEMPEEEWDLLMNVNLKGAFRCIKACLPSMISAEKGSIINMSSTQAHRSWDNWTAYAAAKGGLYSMTRQLAGQFGPKNIRFNCISPGTILTPMAAKRMRNEGEKFLKASQGQASMLRYGNPVEVAMTALFLASDESSFITGDDVKVDGGLSTLPRYL